MGCGPRNTDTSPAHAAAPDRLIHAPSHSSASSSGCPPAGPTLGTLSARPDNVHCLAVSARDRGEGNVILDEREKSWFTQRTYRIRVFPAPLPGIGSLKDVSSR